MKKWMSIWMAVVVLLCFGTTIGAIEISADIVMKERGNVQNGKVYIKGEKHRMQVTGQSEYTIIRPDKKVTWMVIPGEKAYMEMPYNPAQKPLAGEKVDGEVSRKLIGSETIDGHPAKKYEIIAKTRNRTETIHQWIATDLDFPIKTSAVDNSWTVEYKNVGKSVQDSLFEVPAAYEKMSIPMPPGFPGIPDMDKLPQGPPAQKDKGR
jgi:hypothetical protein